MKKAKSGKKAIVSSQDDDIVHPLSARGHGHDSKLQKAGLNAVNPMSQSLPSLTGLAEKLGIKETKYKFDKPILGDLFSQHVDSNKALNGLLYRSRIEAKNQQASKFNSTKDNNYDKEVNDSSNDDVKSTATDDMKDEGSEVDESNIGVLNLRQQLAITIRNWSYLEDNDASIISEGAVHAIISLTAIDDAFIKSCCAVALYNLSSRSRNRESLLSLGATAGVITLAMNLKNFRQAQLSAMTLCNLSMQRSFEGIMARDGTILAIVILMGIKGQRLLPVCIQTLYNLTCVEAYFKGCERIVKAVMNLPPPPPGISFDTVRYILMILVNCSRYSWMRLRVIEDGAIGILMTAVPSLSNRENASEIVECILAVIRALADTQGCRQEMISKGIFDILNSLYSYCVIIANKQSLVKSIHNLITGTVLSIPIFESAVTLVCRMTQDQEASNDLQAMQYCCACLQNFSSVQMRGSAKLTLKVVECMPFLLGINDTYCRYYAISTVGYIFFTNLCQDRVKIENLLRAFIAAGDGLDDIDSVRELTLSFSKLSVEQSYMQLLEKLNLMSQVLTLLLRLVKNNSMDTLVEESCCVAICRISLKSRDLDERMRKDLAEVLMSMLSRDSLYLLENAMGCIYALGEVGLCLTEMLSSSLINNIASIATKFADHVNICRTCCAALVVFSQTGNAYSYLASDNVLNMLLTTTKSKDATTREFVAMTLCNLSTDVDARDKMINKGVVEVVGVLSATTSESLLQICAKCICNLTLAADLQNLMCKQNILQIIMMISLVRCVVAETKRLCARSAFNLVSAANLHSFRTSGAVRVFAVLSQVDDKNTQLVCARGYFLLTSTPEMREELIQHTMVLQVLFAMVKNASAKTKAIVGLAVCNLLACPLAQNATLAAGGLAVVKIFVTMNKDSLKEAVSKVLINLASTVDVHNYLHREPIFQVLNLIVKSSRNQILSAALLALSCLGQNTTFRSAMVNQSCAVELVNSIIQGHIRDSADALEVTRSLMYMSYESEKARSLAVNGHIILALHVLYGNKGLLSPQIVRMIAIIVRNLSFDSSISSLILQQDAFSLLLSLIREHPDLKAYTLKCAVTVVHNLSCDEELHVTLIRNHIIAILKEVISDSDCTTCSPTSAHHSQLTFKNIALLIAQPGPKMIMTEDDAFYICRTLNNLSKTPGCHEGMANGGIIEVFNLIYPSLTEISKFEVSAALSRVASSRNCREPLAKGGVSTILLSLSMSTYLPTQQQCNLAMSYLSDITRVDVGNVASTLMLCLSIDEKTSEPVKETLVDLNVRPEDVPKDKSLRAMINEGLAGKKAELKLQDMPGKGKSEPLESNIPESIAINKQYHELIRIESEQLKGNYAQWKYETITNTRTMEWGGGAKEIHIQLPLPTMQDSRNKDLVDRSGELQKVFMRKDPLDKDLTDWSPLLVDAEVAASGHEPASTPKKAQRLNDSIDDISGNDDGGMTVDSSNKPKFVGLAKYKDKLPGKAWNRLRKSVTVLHDFSGTGTGTGTGTSLTSGRVSPSGDDALSVNSDLTTNS